MYNYEIEKNRLFTDEGQKYFLKVRENVFKLIAKAGAVRFSEAVEDISCPGNSFIMHAAIDRMVELGEIEEVTQNVVGQNEVYVAANDDVWIGGWKH